MTICFVKDQQTRFCVELEIVQLRLYCDLLSRPIGIRGIQHVHQQIRLAQLFERGAKGVDEIFGQIGDESDGIRNAHVFTRTQVDAANRRIERRKGLICDEDVATRERVEQR